ncbi:hypothetical protein UY3_02904 [Chelonia mydas]|uniref:Myb/SANT-like DNA-binding domain-containing protein n=1 Tax=Chelonia mydas TaxID=8469 RepID=M7BVQ8_CHEMY|nr:hypothetical protein UY3_02904 [Chelonia mydas]
MPVLAPLVIGLNSTALPSDDQLSAPSCLLGNACSGLSISFQVAMPGPRTRRSPAWRNAELLDLISIWGEEAVQSHLRSSRRNYDTYGQISRCMTERRDRNMLQCRVKVKELRNTYHKVQEANRRSGATLSWQFYEELDAILGGDQTSSAKIIVDTSVARVPVESGPSQEEEMLDEDVEGERDRRQRMTWRPEMSAARSCFLPRRRLAVRDWQSANRRAGPCYAIRLMKTFDL